MKNVLVLHANPNKKEAFTWALCEEFTKGLKEAEHNYEIGKGVVEIGEEEKEVGPDTLIDSPARIPHCWYNRSDDVFRVLVVKIPRPTESAKLL